MSESAYVIVVMGVSGSGKSTVGPLISAHFACPFIEGDDLHSAESVAKMRAGIPLDDADRWPWLARLGQTADDAARHSGHAVAACSALRKSYRDRIREQIGHKALFVLLDASTDDLERRLAAREDHFMPPSLLRSQQAWLEIPGPNENAQRFVTGDGYPDLISDIISWLEQAMTERE